MTEDELYKAYTVVRDEWFDYLGLKWEDCYADRWGTYVFLDQAKVYVPEEVASFKGFKNSFVNVNE